MWAYTANYNYTVILTCARLVLKRAASFFSNDNYTVILTCERLVTLPRKELRGFSLSGEVGAEVVLLEGRPPAAVMSAPSREVELGRGGPSRGVTLPSLTTDNMVEAMNTRNQRHHCMNGKIGCGTMYGPVLVAQCLSSGNGGINNLLSSKHRCFSQ